MTYTQLPTCVPASLTDDANHLVTALGDSPACMSTWGHLPFQDDAGNLYGTRNLMLPEGVQLQSPLSRPDWDTEEVIDMDAAERALAAISVHVVTEEDPTPPTASPDHIRIIIGVDVNQAVTLWGLTRVEADEADLTEV